MKTVGIYSITNLKNNKIYIGSTKNFERRYYYHLNDLRNNRHFNIHLQRAFNIDGEDFFIYNLVEECDELNLVEKEEYYIEKFNSCDEKFGYNINPKSDRPPSWIGKNHSEETKSKISISQKGKFISDYIKKRASETHKGKKLSDENKIFLKNINSGEKNAMFGKTPYDVWLEKYGKEIADKKLENWKNNISKSNKGRFVSDETREKISKSNKGKTLSKDSIEKIRVSKIGIRASEKTKKLMSELKKGENNSACKIKNSEVVDILNMINNGEKIINIAKKYNVSRRTIYNIKIGKRKF
jgi:group I intron endonuclease